ncbi:MAG TPA: TIGR01777 family oxidoreductase [Thermoanaerobaculia bacterium]|nr:TIGR01777 family oxidoreductase [Thermoanaerobaculia bacterium]
MKVVIPGGSGHIGSILARSLERDGHEVIIFTRGSMVAAGRAVGWDGRTLGPWTSELAGADVVINLAGRSVNCRYNARNRRAILESRLDSTRVIGQAIARSVWPPRVWLQASTATIYAHRFDAANDEQGGSIGGSEPAVPETWRFSIDVAKGWERALDEADTPLTRKVKLRSAIVMSPEAGGPFDMLLELVRHGLGGRAGDGRQFVSWIHYRDFVNAMHWILDHEELSGAINVAAPDPLPNSEFMAALRSAWGIRFGLPAPRWLLEAGAFVLRTESELILKSRRVIPGRLLASGFTFEHPTWPEAARDLCTRWRAIRREMQAARRQHDRPKLSRLSRHHSDRDDLGGAHAAPQRSRLSS